MRHADKRFYAVIPSVARNLPRRYFGDNFVRFPSHSGAGSSLRSG